MKTSNCNIKRNLSYDVYCGRGNGGEVSKEIGQYGWLGNPIKVSSVSKCSQCGGKHETPGRTLKCYETYLVKRLNKCRKFRKMFFQLKGKKLGCFCKPKICHTDIMIDYLDGKKDWKST